ncbi:MAG TPA: hypothetical protein ENJ00_11605, partial [Phycisphaerales bacterium]|nr:hypothetical protein [Phycisphaerales bacterium]
RRITQHAPASNASIPMGREYVFSPWLDNHIGYAGYRLTDQTLTAVWHVRFRDYVTELGTWTRRDPIGYAGGVNVYGYMRSRPFAGIDPMGLAPSSCGCGGHRPRTGDMRQIPTISEYYLFQPQNEDIEDCVDKWYDILVLPHRVNSYCEDDLRENIRKSCQKQGQERADLLSDALVEYMACAAIRKAPEYIDKPVFDCQDVCDVLQTFMSFACLECRKQLVDGVWVRAPKNIAWSGCEGEAARLHKECVVDCAGGGYRRKEQRILQDVAVQIYKYLRGCGALSMKTGNRKPKLHRPKYPRKK